MSVNIIVLQFVRRFKQTKETNERIINLYLQIDLSMKPLVSPFHRTTLENDVNAVVQSSFQIRPIFSLDSTQRDSLSKNPHLSSLEIKQFKCDESLKTSTTKNILCGHNTSGHFEAR